MASSAQAFVQNCIPPSLYVVNLRGECDHGETEEARFVLPSFIKTLQSVEKYSYGFEGATYTPDGGSIFVDTEIQTWALSEISNEEPEEVAKMLETITSNPPTTMTVGPQAIVFNGSRTVVKKISSGPLEAKSLITSFITVCQCLYAKRYVVQGATLAPEGGRIFIQTTDEQWQTYMKF
ncbi:hypothetical protein CPB83DRAFT_841619 [Crepidotus variabilis]|uniref:Uncharacterized protein n=1 Tax=Crepidotus variabilis TaxID=179855 RepID=A0A9P6JW92_9AGAR|nr:hypothetical protein CPB83DRAFT_841619 [Crepidotus variabilis]